MVGDVCGKGLRAAIREAADCLLRLILIYLFVGQSNNKTEIQFRNSEELS